MCWSAPTTCRSCGPARRPGPCSWCARPPGSATPMPRPCTSWPSPARGESIDLTAAYFAPRPAFVEALADAARRGVRVRVLVPGAHTDEPLVRRAGHAVYQQLLDAGVRIWEYGPTMLHAKSLTVDGAWSSVGSVNFDNRSFQLNDEATLCVQSEQFAADLTRLFDADLAVSKEIRPGDWPDRAWRRRAGRAGHRAAAPRALTTPARRSQPVCESVCRCPPIGGHAGQPPARLVDRRCRRGFLDILVSSGQQPGNDRRSTKMTTTNTTPAPIPTPTPDAYAAGYAAAQSARRSASTRTVVMAWSGCWWVPGSPRACYWVWVAGASSRPHRARCRRRRRRRRVM